MPRSHDLAALGRAFGRLLAVERTRERAAAERRHAQATLHDVQSARDRFMVQLVDTQESDARRIADVLHDEVVQQLTALQFRLELQAQKLEAPSLRDLAGNASEIIVSIRRLLVELHPAVLDSQGLAPAVDAFAEGLRERGIDVRVAPFPHRLPRDREVLAYRLVQEVLANLVQHSRAGSAAIEFQLDDDVLHGRVSDTGRGAPEGAPESIGLAVARERVELAGGRFAIESSGPQGTTVVFELPVSSELRAERIAS